MTWRLGTEGAETELPAPTSFSFPYERIVREERASSGRLNVDVVARKRSFELSWSLMDESEYAILEAEFEKDGFLSFVHPTGTHTVWFSSLSKDLVHEEPIYYENVRATLEER